MRFFCFLVFLVFGVTNSMAQYSFSGHVSDTTAKKTVYLSVIEDYRKISRTYLEQIVKKTVTDSTGFFSFKGDNLLPNNSIYSIHIDECSETKDSPHFFGNCSYSKSVLFIANANDTIYFPTTFNDEIFCEITSTNPASNSILGINLLKEEMVYDFASFRSEANRKLSSKKWFAKLQEYGKSLNEPLAELYIFEFLSDRRNETYDYYVKDVQENTYYDDLLDRLQNRYPNTLCTQLYESEILADRQLKSKSKTNDAIWFWVLGTLLVLSVLVNAYLFKKKISTDRKQKENNLKQLTQQEQKIISLIAENKTNKEIASELFISVSTVKTHINNLYKKLTVSSREEIKQLFS